MKKKWIVISERTMDVSTVYVEFDNFDEANEEYKIEGGKGYITTLVQVIKQKHR